jgi:hypothetical protein
LLRLNFLTLMHARHQSEAPVLSRASVSANGFEQVAHWLQSDWQEALRARMQQSTILLGLPARPTHDIKVLPLTLSAR